MHSSENLVVDTLINREDIDQLPRVTTVLQHVHVNIMQMVFEYTGSFCVLIHLSLQAIFCSVINANHCHAPL